MKPPSVNPIFLTRPLGPSPYAIGQRDLLRELDTQLDSILAKLILDGKRCSAVVQLADNLRDWAIGIESQLSYTTTTDPS